MQFDPVSINQSLCILTFVEEVDRMWYPTFRFPRMSWNWASFFFYLNQYLILFSHGPVIMEFFWATSNHHDKLQTSALFQSFRASSSPLTLAQLPCPPIIPSVSGDRHSSHHFLVLALLVGLAIGAVAFGCWSVLSGKDRVLETDQVLPVGCVAQLTHSQGIHIGAAWGGMLIFDTVVFGMTLLKSLTLRSKEQDLISVLLRDGAIYFRCIFLGGPFGGPFTRGVGTIFVNIISSVMISRLMLNLRDPNLMRKGEPGMDSTAGVCPIISTLAHTNYSGYSNDGLVPTDIFNAANEVDEENNGYRGPGRPSTSVQTHAVRLAVNYRL
ncbi:uncharacterized protein LACBIDRAFT_299757 [Laccaria bicolor S238N-H82]|uniref:Predicted protein n=1 Tax=Laccaria bicolor (strain S238N-H82 / ATCC MYA-4686) TaxID=486041 RepID=B0DFD6_LACBS|nr:uncharacterized protein LACBIDRAFT_299757 [Laccaria bicolor S238N-H82]EDR06685.1 predicted protein [Laccaria bicolor S238N-H82]|eukprot:XP_001882532.1 predicted protein [Laccaria bicolor S238N-H82]